MAYADDRVAAVEVEVFLTFGVPDAAAAALDDVDVEERVDGKEGHCL